MFSYLRPHRRAPSTSTSPAPEQSHSWEGSPHSTSDSRRHPDTRTPESSTKKPPLPPSLPPIARVPSEEPFFDIPGGDLFKETHERDQKEQNSGTSSGNARARDIHTSSNHSRIPAAETQRPRSAEDAGAANRTTLPSSRSQTGMDQEPIQGQRPAESDPPFATASDSRSKTIMASRRPAGAKLPTPPSSASNATSTFEPVQPRSGKRLNLLNPMALLARRRTHQSMPPLSAESLASGRIGDNFNDNFDPRIKGTVVHDFSAPRPRKIVSTNDPRNEGNKTSTASQSQKSPNALQEGVATDEDASGPWASGNHTPVFTENFEEEQYPAAGPHVRKANDLSDLPMPNPPYAHGTQKSIDPNLKAGSSDNAEEELLKNINTERPVPDIPPAVPPKAEARRISIDQSSTPPKSTPSKTARSRNVSEVSAKDAISLGIPRHMKSTSSRFSFDMIGAAEQERILEDRHRQRALEKENQKANGGELDDEFDDEYNYDNMDDDDGLEEKIPGVNADYDEEDPQFYLEEQIPGVNIDAVEGNEEALDGNQNIEGFSFQQTPAVALSPGSSGMASTPRDANGDVIGFAMTKNSPTPSANVDENPGTRQASSTSPQNSSPGPDSAASGLGIEGVDTGNFVGAGTEFPKPESTNPEATEVPRPSVIDDDDLYFDDGTLEGPGEGAQGVEFDESVFDRIDTDRYGRPLKPFSLQPIQPTLYSPPTLPADPLPLRKETVEADDNIKTSSGDAISPGSGSPRGTSALQPSTAGNGHEPSATQPSNLTQDSLAAYQSALAAAAFNAAANGKFRRDSNNTLPSPSEHEDAHPGLVSDSSRTSHYEPFSPNYDFEDDFDYDDALEDDPIIAAANAEALANDMDGFYGQEFGFYSMPSAGEAEYANGGYFGPRGVEGINRSQSGRVASREPNLTPITERSEYSNRNSFMSLSLHGSAPVVSPGLAQLAGMPEYDGDMSLNALLKLRRGAWGGSQASLHSSTGSPRSAGGADDSSPVGQLPPWTPGAAATHSTGGHKRQNSGFSVAASDVQSEDNSAPASPTLATAVSSSRDENKRPVMDDAQKEKEKEFRKHRHTGSAESISYSKEDDPHSPTGERWILERRRTSEHGVELLGREIVSGGTI